jgi:formate/nitrite transporter
MGKPKISHWRLLRNWIIVYFGNLVGSVATAVIIFLTKQYNMAGTAVGIKALDIGLGKVHLDFGQAIVLGIMCNALVCLAVWLTFSARSTVDKIAAIIFPITAFVAAGFEHCVANMYFVPYAILVKSGAPDSFWQTAGVDAAKYADLSWGSFFVDNLLPVTIGNIIEESSWWRQSIGLSICAKDKNV